MAYVDGFLAAVPKANKDAYLAFSSAADALFRQWGATRVVECWGDDVPKGSVTDFWRAVAAKDDEVVVFSWVEYPDKETRDAIQKRMMNDPEMAKLGELPLDGKRMVFGGFTPIVDV